MTTPKLQMPELVVGQAGKELTHNQALAVLDQLAQAVVVDKDLTAPPGSPANGSMYIVAAGATGAWSGMSGKLAYWLTTVAAWTFITPADGWSVWVADESKRYERVSGTWAIASSGSSSANNLLINGAFQVNQLAVSGTVTLSAGVYGHDMYKAGASGCTYTFSTSANVTTITITAGSLIQIIEGINLQSGTHILTWTGTAQGKIGAGSYGASGITGTVAGGTNLPVEFNVGTLSFIQLERGTVATPFERRPYAAELVLCQRYYQVLAHSFAVSGTLTGLAASFRYPVEMRTAPTALTKYTDASFSTSGSPPIGSWGLQIIGVSVTAKTSGTFAISGSASSNSYNLYIFGATLDGPYNFLVSDPTMATTLSARL